VVREPVAVLTVAKLEIVLLVTVFVPPARHNPFIIVAEAAPFLKNCMVLPLMVLADPPEITIPFKEAELVEPTELLNEVRLVMVLF
jgi:hypothetical protein